MTDTGNNVTSCIASACI